MDSTLTKCALVTRRYGLEANGMEVLEMGSKEQQYPSRTSACLVPASRNSCDNQKNSLVSVHFLANGHL